MHMHDHHDPLPAVDDPAADAVQDGGSAALTEALHASFRVLKLIMVVVFLLYLLSGTVILDQNEQALVFRFGRLQDRVLGPGGFHATLPRPFDELVRMPVAQKRTLEVTSQFLKLEKDEDSARATQRSGPLDPKLDGSLLTGDKGLIHGRWVVTYEIDDLRRFVQNVYGAERKGDAGRIIQRAVENAAVAVVGQLDAVQATRTRIDELQPRILSRAQQTLRDLGSGIRLAAIDTETIPPVQTRAAFENVTKASNNKRKLRDEARADSTWRLNATAGPAHVELEPLLAAYLDARSESDPARAAETMHGIEQLILTRATGRAGELIREAESFKKQALEDIRADVKEFRAYLVEYERNRELLFERLWIETQQELMTYPTLTKRYLPPGRKQLRLQLSPDPEWKRKMEQQRYQGKGEGKEGDFVDWQVQRTPEQARVLK